MPDPRLSILSSLAVMCFISMVSHPAYAGDDEASVTKIVVDGSTTVGPIAKAFAEHYMKLHPGINVTVSESGSGNGAKGLMNGVADVASMSRFMKQSEFEAAVSRGIQPVAHAVALDALAVVVHPSNPVRELSLGQVQDIYAGKISNWSQVGGPTVPIVVVGRDTNSGTFESFEEMVMRGQRVAASCEHVGSNGAIRSRVQSTQGAIGYVGMAFLDRTIRPLAIDGVAPEKRSVFSGRYPIARPLFLFTNGFPRPSSPLYNFVTLHLTPTGQQIVESIGFIPTAQCE